MNYGTFCDQTNRTIEIILVYQMPNKMERYTDWGNRKEKNGDRLDILTAFQWRIYLWRSFDCVCYATAENKMMQ